MTRFIEFLISLLIVVVVFVVIGLFLPSKRMYSYSIETNRPMATVNDLFNGFSRFSDWNPLLRYDKRAKPRSAAPNGEGAKFSYSSRDKTIGTGAWKSSTASGERIRYRLTGPERGATRPYDALRAHRPAQPEHPDHPGISGRLRLGPAGRYAGSTSPQRGLQREARAG